MIHDAPVGAGESCRTGLPGCEAPLVLPSASVAPPSRSALRIQGRVQGAFLQTRQPLAQTLLFPFDRPRDFGALLHAGPVPQFCGWPIAVLRARYPSVATAPT